MVLLVAGAALGAAPGTNAAQVQEVTLTLAPCVPVGAADAGGEAEWKSTTHRLKVELWGATDFAGRTLDVFVSELRDDTRLWLLVGSLTIDSEGEALVFFDEGTVSGPIRVGTLYSSDPAFC